MCLNPCFNGNLSKVSAEPSLSLSYAEPRQIGLCQVGLGERRWVLDKTQEIRPRQIGLCQVGLGEVNL